jgi:methylase of polypeptide subunit release factors
MADVTRASESLSSEVPGGPIIQRMAEYAQEHPEATEYSIVDEAEAQALLLAIAEQVRVMLDVGGFRGTKRHALQTVNHAYRRAVQEGCALKYIAGLTAEEELEVFGLKIVVPAIVVHQ